jgi:acyl-CoA thioester hydrolase
MRPPAIPLERVIALGSPCYRKIIPATWLDSNGHMNVRWYQVLYDDAGDELHLRLALTPELHGRLGTGTMDLEHHIQFLNEVLEDDTVAIYSRLVAMTPKRLHYMLFAVNETRGNVASTFECINSFVDKKVRKMTPFPPEVLSAIEPQLRIDSALDWAAPVCGVMKP